MGRERTWYRTASRGNMMRRVWRCERKVRGGNIMGRERTWYRKGGEGEHGEEG
jgi:hypothetical protein